MAGNLHYTWTNAAETLRNMRDFILEKDDKRLAIYGIISTEKPRYNATLKSRKIREKFINYTSSDSNQIHADAMPVRCCDH
jgi:hypothetical protein